MTGDVARPGLLIDRRLPAPLYHQLAATLRHGIDAGRFPPGSDLPTEPALARQLGICRPTVHAALTALLAAGVVERAGRAATGTTTSRVWRVVGHTAPARAAHPVDGPD